MITRRWRNSETLNYVTMLSCLTYKPHSSTLPFHKRGFVTVHQFYLPLRSLSMKTKYLLNLCSFCVFSHCGELLRGFLSVLFPYYSLIKLSWSARLPLSRPAALSIGHHGLHTEKWWANYQHSDCFKTWVAIIFCSQKRARQSFFRWMSKTGSTLGKVCRTWTLRPQAPCWKMGGGGAWGRALSMTGSLKQNPIPRDNAPTTTFHIDYSDCQIFPSGKHP